MKMKGMIGADILRSIISNCSPIQDTVETDTILGGEPSCQASLLFGAKIAKLCGEDNNCMSEAIKKYIGDITVTPNLQTFSYCHKVATSWSLDSLVVGCANSDVLVCDVADVMVNAPNVTSHIAITTNTYVHGCFEVSGENMLNFFASVLFGTISQADSAISISSGYADDGVIYNIDGGNCTYSSYSGDVYEEPLPC